jgi:membrane protein DedA with SNARE-associated domain
MLLSNLQNFGYLAVALFIALECIGFPLPGETTLITASVYAGSTHRLNVGIILAVAAAAAIVGDNLGYLVGRRGRGLVHRYGRYVHLTESRLAVGRYLVHRHGGKLVFFARFVSILRNCASLLAGVNRMPWRRFLGFNAVGAVIWASVFSLGAYALGSTASSLGNLTTLIGIGVAGLLGIVMFFVSRRRFSTWEQQAREFEAAEQAAAQSRPEIVLQPV